MTDQDRFTIRSLSPAYFYIHDRAARGLGRNQIGRPVGTLADAHKALAKFLARRASDRLLAGYCA